MEKNYIIFNGMSFQENTPQKVINILSDYYNNHRKKKIQIFYGDNEKCWNEEYDTIGFIGKSTGIYKIPLLIATKRSYGGYAILTNCIVGIKDFDRKEILYKNPTTKFSTIEIKPSDVDGYTHSIYIDGKLYSNHRTERSAKLLKNKLTF